MTLKPRILAIRLTPKASANRIGEIRQLPSGEEQLTVYVTAPPDKGKANEAMLRLLAKHLGVSASRLRIVRGETSRNKTVQIDEHKKD